MANSIQHVNVMVDDLAAACAFYAGVLGLEEAFTPQLDFPGQFFVVGGGQEIHVNEIADLHPERAHFALDLEDFNGAFARALEQGVLETETWGPVKRVGAGIMQAFVRDPAGNLVELRAHPDYEVDAAILALDFVDGSPA